MSCLPQAPRSPQEVLIFKQALDIISHLYNDFDVLVIDEIPDASCFYGHHISFLDKGWCWAEVVQALLSGKLEQLSGHIIENLEKEMATLQKHGISNYAE